MRDRLAPSPLAHDARDDFLSTSSEDLHVSSPPYRPVASSSHLNLLPEGLPPSPAYASTTRVHEMPDERAGFRHIIKTLDDDDPDPRPDGYDTKSSRPTVHYPDTVNRGVGPAPGYYRTDSTDFMSSRPSSIAPTEDEDSDDYDWSGEEDLVDEEAKFEERMRGGGKTKRKGWGFKRIVTLLFSTIIGSTFLAGVLVTPGILIQIYWYKPHPTEHRRFVKDNVQSWLFWAAVNLVISWYLAMLVDVIPVLVRFFISVAWGHVSEFVKTRIEMYDSIKNNIKPLLYAASGWVSWIIIFTHIYKLYDPEHPTESRARYTYRLQQVVEFMFFFALMICVKQMLSHFVAFSFHQTAYKDRVEAVHQTLDAVETLRQYRPPRSANARKSPGTRTPLFGSMGFSSPIAMSDKEHFTSLSGALRSATPPGSRSQFDHDDGTDADADSEDPDKTLVAKGKKKERMSWLRGHAPGHGHKGKKASDSPVLPNAEYEMESFPLSPGAATPSTFYGDTSSPYRYPPTPATQAEEGGAEATLVHAAKVFKNAVLHDARNIGGKNEGDGSMAWNVSSTQEAKRLARAIYTRFKDRGRTYLLPSDFHPAFPTPELAEAAFRVFDKDNNGDISRAEIKSTVVKVYKERRFLARSMRDVGAALKTLDNIILVFAMIILFFISLSVFGVEVGDSLTSVYSIGIAASFIFKNAASSAFDAIMFLFVTHPYDTGDRCFIDEEVLVVKKVGLFATVFTRSDGSETYYFNSQLFSKFITNVRRSGNTFENLTLQVAWRTPLTKIDALEKCLNEWLSTEEKRWFEPTTSIAFQHIEFQRYLILTIGISHNGNWQVR
ncbi:Mechanosensitive ion channel protein 9 [Hypsizygus marmoreus]|uniref:Mechanosensitive ion channel protein 9 n=1 Tax=Hypsizygus marmoreus TaxID=39966 RepID=A0A369JGS2_HYPMA|nr:Mechanosensitive ion channel protein 9 [Hypsizygus marmoreus]